MSSISDDDDSGPSLKELVTKNLEANGILGKLQAQLRASVFLILEEEFQEKNIPILNEKTHERLNCDVGKLALSIIQDFLQCLNLEFTLAVFCPETKCVLTERTLNRQYLAKQLGRNWKDNDPVLFQLIEASQDVPKKETEHKDTLLGGCDAPSKKNSSILPTVDLSSKIDGGHATSINSFITSDVTDSRIPSVANPKGSSTKSDPVETEEGKSERENSQKEIVESSESKHITKNDSTQSATNGTTKTSSNNESSSSTNSSDNETSNQSTLNTNQKSEKNTLSGIEKEYEEEEFSSLSEVKNHTLEEGSSTNENDATEQKEDEDRKETKKSEDKTNEEEEEEESEIEEAVETAEDVEEDISLDDLLSSNSEVSNITKDITVSKDNNIVDYEESL